MNSTITAWGNETTTTTANGSAEARPCDKHTPTMHLLIIVVSLVGLAGNAVVLWLLGFRMRRSAFSVYILHLAAADFLYLCFRIIHSLRKFIGFFRHASVSLPGIFNAIIIFPYIMGLSILTTISIERCLSVLCPIWYRCHRPNHLSTVMCALLWALSLLLSVLEGNQCGFLFGNYDNDWCQIVDFIAAGWLIFLCMVLCGSNLALLVKIFCRSRRMLLTRLYVTILLTVLVFLLCGLPIGLFWFLLSWIENDFYPFSCHLYRVASVVNSVNSCANPIIYFFVGSFRQRRGKTLKLVLQRALQDSPEVDECEGSLSQNTLELSVSGRGK
ncbi:mas-related G-protein coupled receptor member X2-like [Cynocephalus volans]|uniref:mas-related G-protein coupled receptor member X2-like n=1 Tax=Cynocephalus volans TaxID=110931 RepID=UPI002FC9A29C